MLQCCCGCVAVLTVVTGTAGPDRAGTVAIPQPSARAASTAIMDQHGNSYGARGRPAEARTAKHPAASKRMAADAPDQECPIDLSDPYIVNALRALHDSGLDIADATQAAPGPLQATDPSARATPTPAIGVQPKRRPASPVVGLGAAGIAAARAPVPDLSELLGHVQAPTLFSGFSAHPQPRVADSAAPYWPIFAQQAHPGHRQRVLSQQAWPHLQPMYFPAPVFTPPKPLSGALLRSSADSSDSRQDGPAMGDVPQPSHAGQQARAPAAQAPPVLTSVAYPAGEPALQQAQQDRPGQVLTTQSRSEAAAVASSVWGVQLRHFPGKYGHCEGRSA